MQLPAALLAAAIGFATFAAKATADSAANGRASVQDGLLVVETGDYVVRFRESAAWTLHSADFQGHPLLTPTGAYQSVMRVRTPDGKPGDFIGTGHGGETVESIALHAGGAEHALSTDLALTGETFTLVKTSRLGPYAHEARVTVSPDGLTEDLRFEMVGEPVDLHTMYAFMHCFNNQTLPWLVGLGDGEELRGEFTDDNSFTLREDIRWAAVYAPEMGAGMVYAYPEAYASGTGLKNTFWNRPRDNKLYLTVRPSQDPGATFGYSVTLRGFTAPAEDWESAAKRALEPLLAESTR